MSGAACHCLCRLWGHDPSICNGKLDRLLDLAIPGGERVKVPVCHPCGEDIGARELTQVDDEREAS